MISEYEIGDMVIYIQTSPAYDGLSIYVYHKRGNAVYAAKPVDLIFEEGELGKITDPTFQLNRPMGNAFIRAMANALTEHGLMKPSDGEEVKAIKYHLEDMRTLVFKKEE